MTSFLKLSDGINIRVQILGFSMLRPATGMVININ